MKIIQVRTHESVNLDGKGNTNFSVEAYSNRPGYEIELIPELTSVQISSESDSVIVPLVNVAFMKTETKYSKAKYQAKEKEAKKPKNNPALNKVNRPK